MSEWEVLLHRGSARKLASPLPIRLPLLTELGCGVPLPIRAMAGNVRFSTVLATESPTARTARTVDGLRPESQHRETEGRQSGAERAKIIEILVCKRGVAPTGLMSEWEVLLHRGSARKLASPLPIRLPLLTELGCGVPLPIRAMAGNVRFSTVLATESPTARTARTVEGLRHVAAQRDGGPAEWRGARRCSGGSGVRDCVSQYGTRGGG